MNHDRYTERLGGFVDRPELLLLERIAIDVGEDHPADQPEVGDRTLKFFGRFVRRLRRERRKELKAIRVLFDHIRVFVVRDLRQPDTGVRFFDVHSRRRQRHNRHVDAEVVHVAESNVDIPMRAFYDVVVARIIDQHATAIVIRDRRVVAMSGNRLQVGGWIEVRVHVDPHAGPFFLTE